MRRNSNISSESRQGGNGGNIRMDSRFLIATKENNDITANAINGRGGNVNINAQGVFGIQFRPLRNDNTSDITASSEFGQTGNVKIDSLGLDPGRDSTELPKTTTDASKQISQACGASTRQNKLTVTGRGGLPPTAYDPLTSDVVWQDARAASSQPTASRIPAAPLKLVPPAVGWVIGAQGKVTLIAAGNDAQPTGIKVVCPNVSK
jgi:large exoprotein involved in heme utilization and adhesion